MIVVADASVALRWFLADSPQEDDSQAALAILEGAVQGRIQLLQPVHFVAEVAAVLARLKPREAHVDLMNLLAIEQRTLDSPEVYTAAVSLASTLGQHVFDTLYHALALRTPGAMLVTADHRYFAKARHLGQITTLADFVEESP